MVSIVAQGGVLPVGSIKPVGTLGGVTALDVPITLTEDGLVRFSFPDGYVKHYQKIDAVDLAVQLAALVKARYGAASLEFEAVPKTVVTGAVFKLKEITYDAEL